MATLKKIHLPRQQWTFYSSSAAQNERRRGSRIKPRAEKAKDKRVPFWVSLKTFQDISRQKSDKKRMADKAAPKAAAGGAAEFKPRGGGPMRGGGPRGGGGGPGKNSSIAICFRNYIFRVISHLKYPEFTWNSTLVCLSTFWKFPSVCFI